MPDFIFDGPAKLIIEPAGSGDTVFSVGRDIYSAWKRWVNLSDNAKYAPAFLIEGGTPIGATGLFTGTTSIVFNGWKLRAAEHDHQLLIIGNIYAADGVLTVPSLTANTNVFVNSAVAAQGISTAATVGGFTSQDRNALEVARDHSRAAAAQTQAP